MTMPSLLVLDQWAGPDVSAGTSKNWLYKGLAQVFEAKVLNADTGFPQQYERFASLAAAVATHPGDFRKEYHRRLEWASKRPRAFTARTRRFQREMDAQNHFFDVVLQVGCLFGPVVLPGALHASYHDQTVAMVEKGWSPWLPPDFGSFREQWIELEMRSLQSKDIILTYSDRTKRSMIEDYGVAVEKVFVAPTACKIDYPSREAVLRQRQNKLLFASTDFFRKGGDILLDAFQILRKHMPALELVLVGGAVPCALPEGASHLGKVTHSELVDLCLESALILHPARHDAFPNVLKEAQACGLPAVASASAGIPEIVRHERTGLILDRPDGGTLAEAVLALLHDAPRLESMRLACLEDRERYKPEVCVGRIAALLTRALEQTNAGTGR